MATSDKHTGTVKWFDDTKGYGFIIEEETKREYFVHFTGIAGNGFKSLAENQRVEFEVGEGKKGPLAKEVVKL